MGGLMKKSLIAKIITPTLLIIIISILSSGLTSYLFTANEYNTSVKIGYLNNLSRSLSGPVEVRVAQAIETSRNLAENPLIRDWLRNGEQQEELKNYVLEHLDMLTREFDYFTTFLVGEITKHFWADGFRLLNIISETRSDDSWYFDTIRSNQRYLLNLDYNPELDSTSLFVNVPIRTGSTVLGVTGVGIEVSDITYEFQVIADPEGVTYVLLVDDAGNILVSNEDSLAGLNVNSELADGIIYQLQNNDFIELSIQGVDSLLSMNRILDSQYYVISVIPSNRVTSFIESSLLITLISMIVSSIIAGILIFFILIRAIAPIKLIQKQLEDIASGEADLTRSLSVTSNDELGKLSVSFNDFTQGLRNIITKIQTGIGIMDSEKVNIVAGSEESAASVIQISANLKSVQATIETLSQNITTTSGVIRDITGSLQTLHNQIDTQVSAIEETSATVEEIHAQTGSINTMIEARMGQTQALSTEVVATREDLSDMANRVSELSNQTDFMISAVKVINDIASQTNLLAMNAAIEAAHAGDHGRGFAVVADEIRKLAETTSQNSKTIQESLKKSVTQIHDISEAFNSTQLVFDRVDESAQSVVVSFKEIRSTVNELSSGMEEITRAIIEIRDAISQVDEQSNTIQTAVSNLNTTNAENQTISHTVESAMKEISQGTNEINSSVNSLNDSIVSLSSQIETISEEVGKFKT
jgi:methyl-accepting chemotaxis protein